MEADCREGRLVDSRDEALRRRFGLNIELTTSVEEEEEEEQLLDGIFVKPFYISFVRSQLLRAPVDAVAVAIIALRLFHSHVIT